MKTLEELEEFSWIQLEPNASDQRHLLREKSIILLQLILKLSCRIITLEKSKNKDFQE